MGSLASREFRCVVGFSVQELDLNYFTLTIKMVQNSARLSGLPCAPGDRWLSRVIRAPIRADMIKGEPALGHTLELWHSAETDPKTARDRYFKHNGRQNTGMPDIVQGLGLPSRLSALATVS